MIAGDQKNSTSGGLNYSVKAKKARSGKVDQLLADLDSAMADKDYDLVWEMLSSNPDLINKRTPCCEVPLIMAIKHWDPRLVGICIKQGANAKEEHKCSKDSKPKRPFLIANEEFGKRTNHNASGSIWEKEFKTYTKILEEMHSVAPFPSGGS